MGEELSQHPVDVVLGAGPAQRLLDLIRAPWPTQARMG